MTKALDCYFPGRCFPSVSVTGDRCALMCKHCSGVFLKRMEHVESPDALLELAARLSDAGGEGFLLTGGSDRSGRVPLERFADAISMVKETTSLRINAHVGLMPRHELGTLVRAGVDAFSVDIYGSDSAIKKTTGLDARVSDFLSVVRDLRALGAPTVAPHICVGIEAGEVVGEYAAIDSLVPYAPDALVIIALMPTRGTPYEGISPPSGDSTLDVIRAARMALPESRLLLGCMRPRSDRSWEVEAAGAGIDGIAMPTRETMRALAENGWRLTEKCVCCALG
ncbi:MAG TPA: radical SAM protein [Thermoplasmata archaeon]|nr:radical SAM protein [Thermoplasmata archaeon]